MNELIIAFGLFLFIEGGLYALFPSKMKNMLKKLTHGLLIQMVSYFLDSKLKIGTA